MPAGPWSGRTGRAGGGTGLDPGQLIPRICVSTLIHRQANKTKPLRRGADEGYHDDEPQNVAQIRPEKPVRVAKKRRPKRKPVAVFGGISIARMSGSQVKLSWRLGGLVSLVWPNRRLRRADIRKPQSCEIQAEAKGRFDHSKIVGRQSKGSPFVLRGTAGAGRGFEMGLRINCNYLGETISSQKSNRPPHMDWRVRDYHSGGG